MPNSGSLTPLARSSQTPDHSAAEIKIISREKLRLVSSFSHGAAVAFYKKSHPLEPSTPQTLNIVRTNRSTPLYFYTTVLVRTLFFSDRCNDATLLRGSRVPNERGSSKGKEERSSCSFRLANSWTDARVICRTSWQWCTGNRCNCATPFF